MLQLVADSTEAALMLEAEGALDGGREISGGGVTTTLDPEQEKAINRRIKQEQRWGEGVVVAVAVEEESEAKR